MGKIVRFYKTEGGESPIKDFLDSLPGKDARKVIWVLMLVEELDILPATYFKKLVGSADIWGMPCPIRIERVQDTGVSRGQFVAGPYARFHEEDPEDTAEGNRDGGKLQGRIFSEAETL